eukprot:scaffold64154_cov45-Prasinocladus_malaysianus.AAC.1
MDATKPSDYWCSHLVMCLDLTSSAQVNNINLVDMVTVTWYSNHDLVCTSARLVHYLTRIRNVTKVNIINRTSVRMVVWGNPYQTSWYTRQEIPQGDEQQSGSILTSLRPQRFSTPVPSLFYSGIYAALPSHRIIP